MDASFWDDRYSQDEFVYGKGPNEFFKDELRRLKRGTLLLPCEGEGRNAVYAAQKGWHVDAFDFSQKGKDKCLALAEEANVTVNNFWIQSAEDFQPFEDYYDAVALLFCHIEPDSLYEFHQKMVKALKSGGTLLFEGFSKEQLQYNSGGPPVEERLVNQKIIKETFKGLNFQILNKSVVQLDEGEYHQGEGSVIRMIGHKP